MNKSEIKILVVEEDKIFRRFICEHLSDLGYQVDSDDEKRWIPYLHENLPHVILIDGGLDSELLEPPLQNTICTLIRQTEAGKKMGIVGMSAQPRHEQYQTWLDSGADAYWDIADLWRLESTLEEVVKKYEKI